jgi:hypothetical protein
MTFWTSRNVTPKVKSKFVVKLDQFILKTVKTVTKPSVEVNTKEFKLINHYFNYPGIAKWQPITITFVDMRGSILTEGGLDKNIDDGRAGTTDTAKMLYDILTKGGYYSPKSGAGAGMSKQGFEDGLKELVIQQISPGDPVVPKPWKDNEVVGVNTTQYQIHVTEQWKLINPIVKSIKWGDLDYGSDDLVEYSMEIAYDYAEFSSSPEKFVGSATIDQDAEWVWASGKGGVQIYRDPVTGEKLLRPQDPLGGEDIGDWRPPPIQKGSE